MLGSFILVDEMSKRASKLRKPQLTIAWWLVVVQAILVRYLKVDDHWIEQVRQAAARGPIVFVVRNRSLIDFLCLRGLCTKHDLPTVSFVSGLRTFFYLPFVFWLFGLFQTNRVEKKRRELMNALASEGSAVVFLRRPAVRGTLGSRPTEMDGIRLAVESQSQLGISVLALPTVFLWGEQAMSRAPAVMDFLFGSNEYPRLVRSVWLLLRRRSIHDLILGEPLDIGAIRSERNIEDAAMFGVIRAGVGRRIEQIRKSKLGSLTKSSSRVMTEVLNSPRLRKELETIALKEEIPSAEIRPRAQAIIKKMACNFKLPLLSFFSLIMALIWRRLYTSLNVRDSDKAQIKEVVSSGATLILPTHKSHIDYLLISQVMQDNNTMLPHIAAGQNLSFWPMGWIFRSSGAFFIRRTFINDQFYTAVVNAYIRRLIQERYAIEIFVEGGRSRTGKLLRPKLGMIEMSLRAVASSPGRRLNILPVFIGYERVIEERSYINESKGHSKKSENIKGLLGTTKVLLSRYGQLYVRAGNAFTVNDILEQLELVHQDLEKGPDRRRVALKIANNNLREINRISVVSPSALLSMVLLSVRRLNISHEDLRKKTLWLADIFEATGAQLSSFIEKWRNTGDRPSSKGDLFDKTVAAFVRGGRISPTSKQAEQLTYSVREEQRFSLDYYKNNCIHFTVPLSIACTVCLINLDEKTVDFKAALNDFNLALLLYKTEFVSSGIDTKDESQHLELAEEMFNQTIELLSDKGILVLRNEAISVENRDGALFLSDLLLNFHEVYLSLVFAMREKALAGEKGDSMRLARSIAQKFREEGRFLKPEGQSRLYLQSAFQSLKDLKVHRTSEKFQPFGDGEIGSRIYDLMDRSCSLK
jgi:glycerol-3-phosphate O-acyltransferase